MTTVGYGDNVPATHFGRFVCVFTMALGTIIVSLMTAAATGVHARTRLPSCVYVLAHADKHDLTRTFGCTALTT